MCTLPDFPYCSRVGWCGNTVAHQSGPQKYWYQQIPAGCCGKEGTQPEKPAEKPLVAQLAEKQQPEEPAEKPAEKPLVAQPAKKQQPEEPAEKPAEEPLVAQPAPLDADELERLSDEKGNMGCWFRDVKFCDKTLASGFECAPGSLRALRPAITSPPCQMLLKSNVRRLLLVGDSFMRHVYGALVLLLSEDYRKGALINQHGCICHFNGQFREKKCRQQLQFEKSVCNGKVRIQLKFHPIAKPNLQDLRDHDVVVWSMGNHPLDLKYTDPKLGVNDAAVIDSHVLRPLCSSPDFLHQASQKLVWMDVHPQGHGLDPKLINHPKYNKLQAAQSHAQIQHFHTQIIVLG